MKSRCCLLMVVSIALLAGGCVTTREVTIRTRPSDATVSVDGETIGTGTVTANLVYASEADQHRIVVSRMGYEEHAEIIRRDPPRKDLLVELKPESRTINILVEPAPAIITVDGKPINTVPTKALSYDLVLGVDAQNRPIERTLKVDRDNYVSASRVVTRNDRELTYLLELTPMRKKLAVVTNPPGAQVFLDDVLLGVSPVMAENVPFPVAADTNAFLPRTLRAVKPGFDTTELSIGWDNGLTDYGVDLVAKRKTARFFVEPAGATVMIDGQPVLPPEPGRVPSKLLVFPPINESGELKTYSAIISKKTNESEWEPQTVTIGWDEAQSDYRIQLKEILTTPVAMLSSKVQRAGDSWEIVAETSTVLAMKDPAEPSGRPSANVLTRLARGTQLGSVAISPDGSTVLFTVLSGTTKVDFRSQMMMLKTDGGSGAEIITDGKSLDIMPSYTPGGDQILFASNRAGRRMNIWSMSAAGQPGITRLTSGDTNDLWPSVDSDPRQRLFYQAMVDTRSDPRLYMTQIGTIFQTDLTQMSGSQPRVGPKNDAVVFAVVNETTGKRDIYRMTDRGGSPQNLTNTPDSDEYDPSWSRDGSKIIFASDRAEHPETGRNLDLWMIDVARPDQPVQITKNGSLDDSPVFDFSGSNVYFRSNRGGEWGIWKIPVR